MNTKQLLAGYSEDTQAYIRTCCSRVVNMSRGQSVRELHEMRKECLQQQIFCRIKAGRYSIMASAIYYLNEARKYQERSKALRRMIRAIKNLKAGPRRQTSTG